MILFKNWEIKSSGELFARQYDNLSRTLEVTGVPEGYDYRMMVQVGGNFDILSLSPMDGGVGVVLTANQLSIAGYYKLQLVGTLRSDGVTKRHTNVLQVYVPGSLSGDANWPTVPSEFSQVEANIRELNSHPPIPGDNGYWMTWDLESHSYTESEFPLPEVATGTGGTNDHSKLTNRAADNQHPMSAITGLKEALDGKQPTGPYLTEETDPTIHDWAKAAQKPAYTASEVGADPSGTAVAQVAAHNTGEAAHSDIRLLIQGLTDRINALADSDDTTLDQLSEVVAYIKSNRTLIEAITTSEVSVADIVDNLTTNVANKPLSAAQGVALKALIDAITVPDKLPNPNALTFTGAVTGSYDGSAPLEVEIPSGGGAAGDYIQIPTGAEVGQTIVVKAVDEDGKPTAWEAADFPSGSGWKEIASTELDSTVQNVFFTEDADGNPFSIDAYSELVVFLKLTLGESFSYQPLLFLSHIEGSKYTDIACIFHTNGVLKTGGDNIVFANAEIIPKGVASLSYFQPRGITYAWQNTVQNSCVTALTEAQLSSINGFRLGGLNGIVSGEFHVYGRVK